MPAAIWFQEKETLPWLSDTATKAARAIDAFLNGKEVVVPPKHQIVTFDQLNTWYYSDAPKTVRPMLDMVRRQKHLR